MSAVICLARHTFLDALREKAFLVLGLFGVVMLGLSRLLNPLALGEGRRVTLDVGLAFIAICGFLLIAVLGTRMVHKEIDRKTILLILAKPIRRIEFLVGKFLGLVGVLAVTVAGMTLLLAGVMVLSGYAVHASLAVAGLFAFLELFVLAALAMLLMAFTSPVLATFFLVGLYLVGHLAPSLIDLAGMLPDPSASKIIQVVFYLLPRLDLYSYTLEVVHGAGASGHQLFWAAAYAAAYAGGALLLALVVFRTREFS
jgi:ABC-type transport system involved in multi-copper enzyme maturation permease subunit